MVCRMAEKAAFAAGAAGFFSVRPMSDKTIGDRMLAFFSSIRIAVVVMVTLAVVCSSATFYEMEHGTPAAQRDIYQTPYFAFLLGLFGVNIFSVMVSRYPWKRHHIGFLIAHTGILAVLVGSLFSLHRGLDSSMALYEGETSDRVLRLDKALHVSIPGRGAHASFPVAFEKHPPRPDREQRFAIPGTDLVLVADGYEPHVSLEEDFEPGGDGPPALHVTLQAPMATQEAWLVADDPRRSHLDLGLVSFGFHTAATEEEARHRLEHREGENHLSFVLAPAGRLLYAGWGSSGPARTGAVETGRALTTPWPAMGVTVDRVIETSSLRRSVSAAPPPEKEERREAAVRVRIDGPSARTEPEWLLWGETRRLVFSGETLALAYRSPEVALPFRVTLLNFNSDRYPGSNMAATYESWVRVDDTERGTSEHHISMNHPLHYRGYIFFQSSFVEGTPMMSIFSVARAPGLPLVYLGTTLIGVGIVWMFYVKPYLAKRQAARALEAHRARENADEAKPAGPVPAPPRPAEPASGRA